MKHHLARIAVILCFIFPNSRLYGQVKVLFSDSLEERSNIYKITSYEFESLGNQFTKSKFADLRIQNFTRDTKRDTVSIQLDKKIGSFILHLLDREHGFLSETDHVVGELARKDLIAFNLINDSSLKINVKATRIKVERIDKKLTAKSSVSNVLPDTSVVLATIEFAGKSNQATMNVLFQGEEKNPINGFLYVGADSLQVRSVEKSKKGKSTGIEIVNKKSIGGLQLPLNHIGPSYFVIDKQMDQEYRAILFAALSLILIINENRIGGN